MYYVVTSISSRTLLSHLLRLAHSWELLEHGPVLLLAVKEAPVRLVEVCVELPQHGCLGGTGDAHVVLHRVQSSENQVEYTHCWSVSGGGVIMSPLLVEGVQ